ncbi:hypothetical protein [Streptomyces graminilatus]|uniref:hypothetical protein n=1 Tax=Streptomyces graminilatus TaxID=1464070 RepID=UPI0006E120D8|nr:hypothetical protein [Streptomyces graminilatus]
MRRPSHPARPRRRDSQADGGLFSRTAWTPGAAHLGDRLDAGSWIAILDRHSRISPHGQTVIRTYRLRPVLQP